METIEAHIESLRKLCNHHHVAKIYLFGSALREDFTDKSDIDFLVRFKPIDLAEKITSAKSIVGLRNQIIYAYDNV